MANNNGDGGYVIAAQVGWLDLKVGYRLALPCIRLINRLYGALESVVCPCYGATEIAVAIIIIIIIITNSLPTADRRQLRSSAVNTCSIDRSILTGRRYCEVVLLEL